MKTYRPDEQGPYGYLPVTDEPEFIRNKDGLPENSRRRSPVTRFTLVLMGLLALFTLYLSQYALVAFYNHRVSILEQEVNLLQHENQELQKQMRELGSLERIERIAVEELGMVPAQDVRYVQVEFASYPAEASKSGEQTEDQPGVFAELREWWENNIAVQAREER